jgi:transcriptional repressor NrdR
VLERHDHAISASAVAKGAAWLAESAPLVVGDLVMEALSAVDPVAYVRIAFVYRNFCEAKGFWRVARADRGG